MTENGTSRKPIQIATGVERLFGANVLSHTLYALCDDGTIWELEHGEWICLLDIPQD